MLCDKVTPDPTTAQIDEAAALARTIDAKAVLCIGGGSPADAGKGVAILLENPQYDAARLYEYEFTPEKAVLIIAINLTHGTDTEVDRVVVATILEKAYKPAIVFDCIYPTWAIDDPTLMTGLSEKQTRFVSIDAVNHSVEAVTIAIARRYYQLYASMLLPAVIKHIYPVRAVVLSDVLAPIVPGQKGDPAEAESAAKGVEKWLIASGAPEKLAAEGFSAADIDKLTELAFTTPSLNFLLSLAPDKADCAAVRQIYADSLTPLNK